MSQFVTVVAFIRPSIKPCCASLDTVLKSCWGVSNVGLERVATGVAKVIYCILENYIDFSEPNICFKNSSYIQKFNKLNFTILYSRFNHNFNLFLIFKMVFKLLYASNCHKSYLKYF